MTLQKQAPRALPSNTAGSAVNDLFEQLTGDTEWHAQAACRGLPTDWYFPQRDDRVRPEALAACQECPVRDRCQKERGEFGVWAGTPSNWKACVDCGGPRGSRAKSTGRCMDCWRQSKRTVESKTCACGGRKHHRATVCRDCYSGPTEHGSMTAYKLGCRCGACREVNRAYKTEWARKRRAV